MWHGSLSERELFVSYILVTNDDGVQAPGILALVKAMRSLGEVRVIAIPFGGSIVDSRATITSGQTTTIRLVVP